MTYGVETIAPGDTTSWEYDEATGLLLSKTYADGHGPAYTYTDSGNLATRTWARGIVTTYAYDGWNNLTNTAYSDGTPSISLAYDAMGRQTNAVDAAGATVTAYDAYGDVSSETVNGLYSRTVSHVRDNFGRDLGYSIGNSRMSIIEYEADTARMKRVMMAGVWFTYYYLPGTDLKSRLQYGGSGSAYYTYEPHRDLLTQVQNYINGGVISQYDYVNDAIGRRTAITRSGSMMSETRTDGYGYNDRNELILAAKNTEGTEHQYSYDDIGNRMYSFDLGTNRTYTANSLNQYTAIDDFVPQFDLDGNQTSIKTATGVWQVTYNGENRPILWECGATNIVMKFDRMGRRVEYIETVAGTTNIHHRFVYDGYLCIQRLSGAANNSIDLVFGWDPSEPVATRPLVMQKYGKYNLFYTHDGNKNVSELVFFQQANGIAAHYEYAPFGAVTATNRSTPVTPYDFREYNPLRFSSEYADDALNLVYYNYRHYELNAGRWTSRDILNDTHNGMDYCMNQVMGQIDVLGLRMIISGIPKEGHVPGGPGGEQENFQEVRKVIDELNNLHDSRGRKCYNVIVKPLNKEAIKEISIGQDVNKDNVFVVSHGVLNVNGKNYNVVSYEWDNGSDIVVEGLSPRNNGDFIPYSTIEGRVNPNNVYACYLSVGYRKYKRNWFATPVSSIDHFNRIAVALRDRLNAYKKVGDCECVQDIVIYEGER